MTRESIAMTKGSSDMDGAFTTCDRCGGRFPDLGIPRNGRVYCCDKCAAGPGAKDRIRMQSAATALVGLGAVLDWSAGRARR